MQADRTTRRALDHTSSFSTHARRSGALGMLTLLAVVMGLSHRSVDSRPAWLLLTVPVLLLLTAGVVGYRLWRSPYENRER